MELTIKRYETQSYWLLRVMIAPNSVLNTQNSGFANAKRKKPNPPPLHRARQLQAMASLGGGLPSVPDREECLFHRRSYEGYAGCPPYDGKLEWPGLLRGLDKDCVGWRGDGGAGMDEAAHAAGVGK